MRIVLWCSFYFNKGGEIGVKSLADKALVEKGEVL